MSLKIQPMQFHLDPNPPHTWPQRRIEFEVMTFGGFGDPVSAGLRMRFVERDNTGEWSIEREQLLLTGKKHYRDDRAFLDHHSGNMINAIAGWQLVGSAAEREMWHIFWHHCIVAPDGYFARAAFEKWFPKSAEFYTDFIAKQPNALTLDIPPQREKPTLPASGSSDPPAASDSAGPHHLAADHEGGKRPDDAKTD